MKNTENRFTNTLEAIKKALETRSRYQKRYRGQIPDHSSVALFLSTLKPETLKTWLKHASSYNHGAYILDQVFPICDNPKQLNSDPFETTHDEQLFQVLGWQEVEDLKQQGTDSGLERDWIEIGFEWRANERGIDLEKHFHQYSSCDNLIE